MTDDAIAKHILKFVRQLDGAESEADVMEAAIAYRWLDHRGKMSRMGMVPITAAGP